MDWPEDSYTAMKEKQQRERAQAALNTLIEKEKDK